MLGCYLEPGTVCDGCRELDNYLQRTPEQWKHVFCKVFPEQNKLEIWKGKDFLGYAREGVITWFSDENGITEISFEDLAVIQDNWNQMKNLVDKKQNDGKM